MKAKVEISRNITSVGQQTKNAQDPKPIEKILKRFGNVPIT